MLRAPCFFVFFKRNFLVEFVIEFDKNHKNRLLRLKPKGTPPGLTPSIKALRLLLALNPSAAVGSRPLQTQQAKNMKK